MDNRGLKRAIAICGSQAELARRIQVPAQTITYYLRRGVPAKRIAQIVQATQGAVKAADLRPDLGKVFG